MTNITSKLRRWLWYTSLILWAHVWKKCLCWRRFFMVSCFYHFRTIMNCNLRVIQPRAFAQNPHLRYMWVNILWQIIFDSHVSHAFIRVIMMCNAWQFAVSGYRWIRVEQKMMQLIGTGFGQIVVLPLLLQQPHILNETSIICLG